MRHETRGPRAKSVEHSAEGGEWMFRFEGLDVWKKAVEIAERLFNVADQLEERKLFRFAEQLRGAALSMPNNIAEDSGNASAREFCRFIDYARRSAFENASMIVMFANRDYISKSEKENLLIELDRLCRMLMSFKKTLSS